MRQVDALGTSREERFRALAEPLLDGALDALLQQLVTEAVRELALPIALVTIVLRRTQFFRAHVGLPLDLAVAQATPRDASFCQFVVRDGAPFEVTHASRDDRVPQELVELYGIEAYLGEPVLVDRMVVGALCVIGTEPRTFSDEDRAKMKRLASRVTERLEDLVRSSQSTNRRLVGQATAPAFGELRNLMAILTMNARSARMGAADAELVARLLQDLPASVHAANAALTEAADRAASLGEVVADISEVSERLMVMVEALETLLGDLSAQTVSAQEVVTAASHLAHHRTKLVGGVSWSEIGPDLLITAPRMAAISMVATALASLGKALGPRRDGIQGSVSPGEGQVVLELRAEGVEGAALTDCVAELTRLIEDELFLGVSEGVSGSLCIRLAALSPRRVR